MTQNNARQLLSKVYQSLAEGSSGGHAIDEQIDYDHLTREQQLVLIRLFGGGTLRGQNESVISGLHRLGFIKGETLTSLGKSLCERALPAILARCGSGLRSSAEP